MDHSLDWGDPVGRPSDTQELWNTPNTTCRFMEDDMGLFPISSGAFSHTNDKLLTAPIFFKEPSYSTACDRTEKAADCLLLQGRAGTLRTKLRFIWYRCRSPMTGCIVTGRGGTRLVPALERWRQEDQGSKSTLATWPIAQRRRQCWLVSSDGMDKDSFSPGDSWTEDSRSTTGSGSTAAQVHRIWEMWNLTCEKLRFYSRKSWQIK